MMQQNFLCVLGSGREKYVFLGAFPHFTQHGFVKNKFFECSFSACFTGIILKSKACPRLSLSEERILEKSEALHSPTKTCKSKPVGGAVCKPLNVHLTLRCTNCSESFLTPQQYHYTCLLNKR